jgi:hypothetical protein
MSKHTADETLGGNEQKRIKKPCKVEIEGFFCDSPL